MKKLTAVALVVLVAGFAASSVWAAERRERDLKALGLKFYWSLLSEDQKAEAKTIFADQLAATAPDRLAARARLLEFRADVAAVLTAEQRKEAGRIRRAFSKLPRAERWARVDAADRADLADLIERASSADPADRVKIGLTILDRVKEVRLSAALTHLSLTEEQQTKIEALYQEFRVEIEPIALRLANAKADAVRQCTALLTAEQRAKVEEFRATVLTKVLAFLRG